jgi:hypothetical protein
MILRLASTLNDLPEVQEVQEVPVDPEALIIKTNNCYTVIVKNV